MLDLIEKIASDKLSGSIALTRAAVAVFERWALASSELSSSRARNSVPEVAVQLARAQPAMAAIFNLCNTVLWAAEKSSLGLTRSVLMTVRQYHRALEQATEQSARHAAHVLPPSGRVITISQSQAVCRTLQRARSQLKKRPVICAESSPLKEGAQLARKLKRLGIAADVVPDALAPSLVRAGDVVLVGGDALVPAGLWNKIGTYALALGAHHARARCLAVISSHKFLPGTPRGLLRQREVDRLFDLTPLQQFSGIITEVGAERPRQVRPKLTALPIHPALKELIG